MGKWTAASTDNRRDDIFITLLHWLVAAGLFFFIPIPVGRLVASVAAFIFLHNLLERFVGCGSCRFLPAIFRIGQTGAGIFLNNLRCKARRRDRSIDPKNLSYPTRFA